MTTHAMSTELRYVNKRLDEVVVKGSVTVHLEDMGGNGWCLIISDGNQDVNIALPRGRAVVVEQPADAIEVRSSGVVND